MKERVIRFGVVLASVVTIWGCDAENPARPSVSFVAPVAQQPTNGVIYSFSAQPLTLQIVNSVTTGNAAVTYIVEVSTTSSFDTNVFKQEGVAQGTDGTTSVALPPLNGNTTYFWRSRAVVDGIVGAPSSPQSFFVKPSLVISAPAIQQPTSSIVYAPRPTFTVVNAARVGPADASLVYEFQVSASNSFGTLLASSTVSEQPTATSWSPAIDLPLGTLFWRVRGKDLGLEATGPFSSVMSFDRQSITISAPALSEPANGLSVFTPRPTFTVTNATRTAPTGTILSYEFQVSTSASFGTLVASSTVQETTAAGTTSWTPTIDLPEGNLFWRVRGKQVNFGVDGTFSSTGSFERRFGIDLQKVVIAYPSSAAGIKNWPETAKLRNVYFDPRDTEIMCTEYDNPGWPEALFFDGPDTVYANQWVFVNHQGTWYGGAAAWMRAWPQFCKRDYDQAFFQESLGGVFPFNQTVLHTGDVIGVMMSTPARAYPAMKTIDERSNIVMVAWPPGR